MMNGREKSDSAILAMKPANNAGEPAAEQVERRAGTKGNTDQSNTCRAQNRASVPQGLERVRQAARQRKKERFSVAQPGRDYAAPLKAPRCCHRRATPPNRMLSFQWATHFLAKLRHVFLQSTSATRTTACSCKSSPFKCAGLPDIMQLTVSLNLTERQRLKTVLQTAAFDQFRRPSAQNGHRSSVHRVLVDSTTCAHCRSVDRNKSVTSSLVNLSIRLNAAPAARKITRIQQVVGRELKVSPPHGA